MEKLENNFNQKPKIEKLDIKTQIAKEKDWEGYKKLKILEMTEEGKEMHDFSQKKLDILNNMTEEEWKKELSRKDMFVVLARNDSDPVGISCATENKRGFWVFSDLHVRKEFRNKGVGKKMFLERLNEVKNRGGKKIMLAVKINNEASIHLAESFGFKKISKIEQLKLIKYPKSLITEQIMELNI
jgi:ribosomal protein S18 acetylase RimI-like enzyme